MIASYVLLITIGLTLLATAVTSASLTCLPLCCRPAQLNTKFNEDHQQPNEANVTSVVVNMDQLAALNVPTIEDLQERSSPPSRVGKIQHSS